MRGNDMGVLSWLIPQEKRFFDMIEKQSENVLAGVDALVDMLEHYDDIDTKRENIKKIENEGDKMVHTIFAELNKTFITPIDREDITKLVSSLDDILDNLEAVAERLVLYEIKKPPTFMLEFAKTLQKTTQNVNAGITLLRNFKEATQIRGFCREVNTLENEGDALLRKATAELFHKKDPVEIIKIKELYEDMEAAIDRCEDVADVVGDILVKYT
jgi:predicted phosphate transport protein (TIGR00153 family)